MSWLGSLTQYVRTKGEGRDQAKCVRLRTRGEAGVQGYVPLQKKFFWTTKSQNFLFLYKRSYYIATYYDVQKSVNRP